MVVITGTVCQRSCGMGPIIWIDQNTFATSLLENVFKSHKISLFTLDNVIDFSYLIDDLSPSLLVLDGETVKENLEAFTLQYETNQKLRTIPKIIIGDTDDLSFVENKIGLISRPFDPFKIPEIVEKLFKGH